MWVVFSFNCIPYNILLDCVSAYNKSYSYFLSKCKDEICGCLRNDKVSFYFHILQFFCSFAVKCTYSVQKKSFFFFLYFCAFVACRLCDTGRWRIPSYVQSRGVYFLGELSKTHLILVCYILRCSIKSGTFHVISDVDKAAFHRGFAQISSKLQM